MPNLSPRGHRKDYSLYDNKLNTGAESAEGLADLSRRVEQTGCHVAVCRGDWRPCPDQS